jgi:hypothetical protein
LKSQKTNEKLIGFEIEKKQKKYLKSQKITGFENRNNGFERQKNKMKKAWI